MGRRVESSSRVARAAVASWYSSAPMLPAANCTAKRSTGSARPPRLDPLRVRCQAVHQPAGEAQQGHVHCARHCYQLHPEHPIHRDRRLNAGGYRRNRTPSVSGCRGAAHVPGRIREASMETSFNGGSALRRAVCCFSLHRSFTVCRSCRYGRCRPWRCRTRQGRRFT